MNSDHRPAALVADLRREGITDERVLEAIAKIPRDVFVDEPFSSSAYENTALPIACGQTISQPFVVAFATQALEIGPKMRVLEIGTGSGYQAAVLSPLCRMVYTVERHKPLLKVAEQRFRQLGLHNIVTRHGDGHQGWPEQAPFDRILLSAAIDEVPDLLIKQLKPNGVLVAPVGKSSGFESFSQHLVKIIRTEEGIIREKMIPVMFVPMVRGLPQEQSDDKDRKR